MPHFATDFDQVGPSVRHHIFLLVCGIALDENSWTRVWIWKVKSWAVM